jgi:hypothetical protein
LCAGWVGSINSPDPSSRLNGLKESLATKARGTIAPGSYKLIDGAGPAPYALPICLVRAGGAKVLTGTGTIVRRPGAITAFTISLPIPGMGLLRTFVYSEDPSPFSIKGLRYLEHCFDGTCQPGKSSSIYDCSVDGFTPERHLVTLEGGVVELTAAILRGGSGFGTEPGEFVRASGTFRGVTFDQRDYFKLVYSPEHHHFVRNFAFFFDAPIVGACGLELLNLSPGVSGRPLQAFAVDCQLNRLNELRVVSATFR